MAKKFTIFFVIFGLISSVLFFGLDRFFAEPAHAAISFVSCGATVKVGSGNLTSIGVPPGIQNNDILVVFLHSRDNVNATMPGDWMQAVEGNGNINNRLEAWWKRTTGTESAPTITHSGGNSSIGKMCAFRGVVEAGSPFDAVGSVQGNTGSTITTAAIATTASGAMIVHLFGSQDNNDWGSFTGIPATSAGVVEANDGAGNNDSSQGVTYGAQTSAGSTGTAGASETFAGTDASASVLIALKRNEPPTLSISQPGGIGDSVTQGDPYAITYTLSDPDNVVTAAFYYDTNNFGLDGTAIAGACATATEGTGATCSWNTTGVTPGSYYVYGITNDGVNGQVSAYSGGTLTVNAVPVISISGIVPNAGTALGGTDVTISGSNFQSGATITFDGISATDIVFVGSGTLTAKTPAHAAGMVDVMVTNPDTTSDTLVNGFTYTSLPVVTITASPLSIFTGESSIINWSTENADTCTASGAWSGAKATSGNETTTPAVAGTHTYTLECAGAGGSGSGFVSVLVTVPAALKEPGILFRFDGFAYPEGKVFLYDNNTPFSQLTSDLAGRFATSLRLASIEEKHLFSVIAYDKEGNISPSKTFPTELYEKEGLIDVLIAPTIALHKRALGNNESLRISGYATPGNKVQVEIDGKIVGTVPTTASGYYALSAPLSALTRGGHMARALQVTAMSRTSDYSLLKAFQISEPFAAHADLNNDGRLTISDWSIFLSSWVSRDEAVRKKIDLNNDGTITIFDLSIFLSGFRKK